MLTYSMSNILLSFKCESDLAPDKNQKSVQIDQNIKNEKILTPNISVCGIDGVFLSDRSDFSCM
jgi:hypothetical protein